MMYQTHAEPLGFVAQEDQLKAVPTVSLQDEIETLYYSDAAEEHRQSLMRQTSLNLETSAAATDMDMELFSANPEEITGQSLALKTEDMEALPPLEMEDALGVFFELDEVKPDLEALKMATTMAAADAESEAADEQCGIGETQDLIDEMEDFLDQYDPTLTTLPVQGEQPVDVDNLASQLLSMEQQQTLQAMNTECPMQSGTHTDEETAAAEDLLDALIKGEIFNDETTEETTVVQDNLQDSGFVDEEPQQTFEVKTVSQISEIYGEDGRNVIFIVAPAEDHHQYAAQPELSPSTEVEIQQTDSDSEWTPEIGHQPKRKRPGRKTQERKELVPKKGRVSKPHTSVRDKKERKKLQNVEAARRYRDKKKVELHTIDQEENKLLAKNKVLREKLTDIENEMKTMKKLMVELGLIKVVRK